MPDWHVLASKCTAGEHGRTMRFGSTAKVLLKFKLKYYRISECGRSAAMNIKSR